MLSPTQKKNMASVSQEFLEKWRVQWSLGFGSGKGGSRSKSGSEACRDQEKAEESRGFSSWPGQLPVGSA